MQELAGLRDFYEANLELATPRSPISIFDVDTTIVSRGKILPPSIIHNCEIFDSLVGEGSVLEVRTFFSLISLPRYWFLDPVWYARVETWCLSLHP